MEVLPRFVREILDSLATAGYECWCVGGCVRDLLRGAQPDDWDVTTSARPEQVCSLFGAAAIPTGARHGTVTVRRDGERVEVTTYRADGVYSDHRHPDSVTFSASLEEDLCRRDFTVNAMALGRDGTLRDPFGGQTDLRSGLLRCVGEADRRFGEDALRILRALRFAAVLGFSLEPATAESLRRNRALLAAIAPERIRTEFVKLLCGRDAGRILREYRDVFAVFLPELAPTFDFAQHTPYHCFDVWEHTVRAVEAAPPDALTRMALLVHDVGKPACFTLDEAGVGHFFGHAAESRILAETALKRLRYDNQSREDILTLVAQHGRPVPKNEREAARALRTLGEETLRRLLTVQRADNLAQSPVDRDRRLAALSRAEEMVDAVLAAEDCFSLRQLAVKGDDLLELGLTGPAVGHTLDALLNAVLDGTLPNDRTALLTAVREGCI